MDRFKEYEKYERAYKQPSYRMGNNRKKLARETLKNIKARGSYLDVGCGRGEMVEFAKEIGFSPCVGVEVVDYLLNENVVYGQAHNLPFKDDEFDVATSFDVFEHLVPEDTEGALREINRVSKRAIILAIPSHPSGMNHEDYHINLRSPNEWTELIKENIDGDVTELPRINRPRTTTWVIIKE